MFHFFPNFIFFHSWFPFPFYPRISPLFLSFILKLTSPLTPSTTCLSFLHNIFSFIFLPFPFLSKHFSFSFFSISRLSSPLLHTPGQRQVGGTQIAQRCRYNGDDNWYSLATTCSSQALHHLGSGHTPGATSPRCTSSLSLDRWLYVLLSLRVVRATVSFKTCWLWWMFLLTSFFLIGSLTLSIILPLSFRPTR